VYTQL
jgi:AcrR family transcriptional regulator